MPGQSGATKIRAHIVEDLDIIVAFFPETFRFFEIDEITKQFINSLHNFILQEEFMERHNLKREQYEELKGQIAEVAVKAPVEISTPTTPSKKILHRLVINVSNTCNLSCRYCYANGGNYLSEEALMTKEVATQVLDSFFEYFDGVNNLQIFGGEPLMNLPIIEYIGEYVDQNYNAGIIKNKPKIGMVSNGTLVNDKVIEVMRKYNMMATISLDGPPEVNDEMRTFVDGTGISEIVMGNIKKMREQLNQPNLIEATYHQGHVDKGISIGNVIRFVRESLGQIQLHIPPVNSPADTAYALKSYQPFVDSVEEVFEAVFTDNPINYSLVLRIFDSLLRKRVTRFICPAAVNTLSVDVKGNIYPCFMFTDIEEFNMGSVFTDGVFETDRLVNIYDRFLQMKKIDLEQCQDCFANTICTGCLGANYLQCGDLTKVSENYCVMTKEMINQVLLELARIYRDPEKQKIFEDKIFKAIEEQADNGETEM